MDIDDEDVIVDVTIDVSQITTELMRVVVRNDKEEVLSMITDRLGKKMLAHDLKQYGVVITHGLEHDGHNVRTYGLMNVTLADTYFIRRTR